MHKVRNDRNLPKRASLCKIKADTIRAKLHEDNAAHECTKSMMDRDIREHAMLDADETILMLAKLRRANVASPCMVCE